MRKMRLTYERESYRQGREHSGGERSVSQLQQRETRSAHCECDAGQRRYRDRGNYHVTAVIEWRLVSQYLVCSDVSVLCMTTWHGL